MLWMASSSCLGITLSDLGRLLLLGKLAGGRWEGWSVLPAPAAGLSHHTVTQSFLHSLDFPDSWLEPCCPVVLPEVMTQICIFGFYVPYLGWGCLCRKSTFPGEAFFFVTSPWLTPGSWSFKCSVSQECFCIPWALSCAVVTAWWLVLRGWFKTVWSFSNWAKMQMPYSSAADF